MKQILLTDRHKMNQTVVTKKKMMMEFPNSCKTDKSQVRRMKVYEDSKKFYGRKNVYVLIYTECRLNYADFSLNNEYINTDWILI